MFYQNEKTGATGKKNKPPNSKNSSNAPPLAKDQTPNSGVPTKRSETNQNDLPSASKRKKQGQSLKMEKMQS